MDGEKIYEGHEDGVEEEWGKESDRRLSSAQW